MSRVAIIVVQITAVLCVAVASSSLAVAAVIVLHGDVHTRGVAQLVIVVQLYVTLLLVWLLLALATLASLPALASLTLDLLWRLGTLAMALLPGGVAWSLEELVVIYLVQLHFCQVLLQISRLGGGWTSWMLTWLIGIRYWPCSSSMVEWLVVLVCHLELELVLQLFSCILLVGVCMVAVEMGLGLAVGRRCIQALYVLCIGKCDIFFADYRSSTARFRLALVASITCVLCMLLFLQHIVYLAHVILIHLSVIRVSRMTPMCWLQ